nr:transposase [[Clostridium] innocuum]
MVDGLAVLDSILGKSLFEQEAHITLTIAEVNLLMLSIWKKRRWYQKDTSLLLRPYAVRAKGSLENMHRELRYILPNEVDLRSIGLTDQTSLNVAISHINSSAKEHLNGKSPFELCEFMCPELAQKLYEFGLQK